MEKKNRNRLRCLIILIGMGHLESDYRMPFTLEEAQDRGKLIIMKMNI